MTEAAAKASTPVTCSWVFMPPPKLKKKQKNKRQLTVL